MNLLLNAVTNVILPIAIIILALIAAVYLYKALRKKLNKPLDTKIKASSKAQVSLKSNYCTEDEMRFLDALHKALPRECISFPRVGVSKLIDPKGSMNDFNSVLDQYVDVVVFLRKEMKPILVIDLYHASPAAQQLKKFDENVNTVLKAVKLPIMKKQIAPTYDINQLLVEVLNHLDTATVTMIRNRYIGVIDKK
jgi:hypothetical protein